MENQNISTLPMDTVQESPTEKKRASKLGVICYGLGDLASQFVWTFVGSYLTIFYTDIVGFTPAIVSAIMLGARIWDAVNDPMMGALAERTRSKLGRFRPWIAFGCPLLALFGVLTFVNPFGASTAGVIFSTVTYIIAGMLYTLVNIPYSSLGAVMTEDADQRNVINTSRNVGMNVGMIIVNGLSATMLLAFSSAGAEVADSRGYMMTALVYCLLSIPLFLAVFFTSKEVVKPEGQSQKFSFKQTIANLVGNKYLMIMTLVMVLQMTAFMGRIAITAYYVIYCLGSFTMIALIMTIPSIGGVIGSFIAPWLAKKIGTRNALMATFFIQAVGLFVMYFAPFDNMTMVLTGDWIFGLGNFGFAYSLTMVADSVDYMEWKTGTRTDGTAFAVYGLATKLGNAIGSAVGVMLLAAFGYVAGAEQTAEALNGINLTVNLIPAILFVLAGLSLLLWNKSQKDMDQIRLEVRQRKEAAAKAELAVQ